VSEPHKAPRWFKCIRADHPAQGGVMLGTVQCRPAVACARKSPPRVHSKETRQDKTFDLPVTRPESTDQKAIFSAMPPHSKQVIIQRCCLDEGKEYCLEARAKTSILASVMAPGKDHLPFPPLLLCNVCFVACSACTLSISSYESCLYTIWL
jgi:hypothetical protein